jgi:hypothetical protein
LVLLFLVSDSKGTRPDGAAVTPPSRRRGDRIVADVRFWPLADIG